MADRAAATETSAIPADIDESRRDLAGTVEALSGQADVRGRSMDKLAQLRDQARLIAGEQVPRSASAVRERPKPVLALVLGVLGITAVVLVRRRRRVTSTHAGE